MLLLGALVLAGALFLLGVGAAPLIDRDEPAYAEAAREMFSRGDWVVTWFNGRPWFDKPPLVYWLEMISFRALGMSEATARLPVALFGLAGLLAVYWIGRRLRSRRAGVLAALALMTSLLYLGSTRVVLMDVPFTVCFTLAMGALVAGLQEPQRARWPLLAGVGLGLAVLAKSPAACLLFVGVLVIVGIATRSPLRLRGLRWGYAALVCVAVAAPWYAAMTIRFGPDFLHQFLGAGNVGRFLQAEHARAATPLFYLPILLIGFLPWTAMLPGSLRTAWRERGRFGILIVWASLVFVFFTVSQSKLPGYILPMFPALALLVGIELDRILDRRSEGAVFRGLYYAAASTLVVAGMALGWAAIAAPRYLGWAALLTPALAGLGLLPLGLVIWARGRPTLGAAWIGGFGLAVAGLLGYGLLPAVAEPNTTKELARRIQADGRPHRVYLVHTDPLHVPSLLFYCRQNVAKLDSIPPRSIRPGDAFVLKGKEAPPWFRQQGLEPVASAGNLTLWLAPARRRNDRPVALD
jgi:4-amino-4-deoxy-L-arabinose transferase-like glycosyltransferase